MSTPAVDPNVVENKVTGEKIVFTKTTEETGGEYVAFDFFVAPKGGVAFEHYHATQSEHFRMRRGVLRLCIDGVERDLRPGDELALPPGTAHSILNPGDEEACCEVEYRPAGLNEWLLKTVHAFEQQVGRESTFLEIAPFLAEGVELYPRGVPRWAGRIVMAAGGAIGRLLGTKERVERAAREYYGGWLPPLPGASLIDRVGSARR